MQNLHLLTYTELLLTNKNVYFCFRYGLFNLLKLSGLFGIDIVLVVPLVITTLICLTPSRRVTD